MEHHVSSERKHKESYIRGCSGKGNWTSSWIFLDNNRSNITIGIMYVLQEDVTANNELKIMYNNINKQISIVQQERQQLLKLGELNAKVATYLEGNNPTATKWGRHLMKMGKI